MHHVHTDSMNRFYPGTMTNEQLLAESQKQGDFLAETVLKYRTVNGKHFFLLKWVGLPTPEVDDPESWMELSECRHTPVVKDFCRTNGIALSGRAQARH